MEKTLVLIKPDGLQRNLIGEIITRFEKKGLKIIGMKMTKMDNQMIEDHYGKYKDKPFFKSLTDFMQSTPIIAIALEGVDAVYAVRLITGSTKAREADAGTIRGDLAMGLQTNIVHVSDPEENPEEEIDRFFQKDELFNYKKVDFNYLYSSDEV